MGKVNNLWDGHLLNERGWHLKIAMIIKAYFHSDEVEWIDRNDDTKLEIYVTCSSDSNYTLRIYLPPDFPNSCPAMVVRSSSGLLRRKNGTFLDSISGTDHTLSSKDGYTQICHFLPRSWKGDKTLFDIVMKGQAWLEAYEIHLQTGDSLDRYLQADCSILLDGVINRL